MTRGFGTNEKISEYKDQVLELTFSFSNNQVLELLCVQSWDFENS